MKTVGEASGKTEEEWDAMSTAEKAYNHGNSLAEIWVDDWSYYFEGITKSTGLTLQEAMLWTIAMKLRILEMALTQRPKEDWEK